MRRVRLATILLVVLFGVSLLALVLLQPRGGTPDAPGSGFAAAAPPTRSGEIVSVTEVPSDPATSFLPPGAVDVRLVVRLDDGREVRIEAVDEVGILTVGRRVEVAVVGSTDVGPIYAVVDLPRSGSLWLLATLFAVAVVTLGRGQGLRALLGLGLSALIVVRLALPAVLAGRDPVVVAVAASVVVMLLTIALAHGIGPTSVAAASGTALTLVVTAGLAAAFVGAANLTGLADEDVQSLLFAVGQPVDLRGLLLAGIIIGTLGVLDDVTVSQAATVRELRAARPDMPRPAVFAAAIRVGRDHIAATVNTLFLAYTGAALPLLLLFEIGGASVAETLSSELVAQEIVRTLVGSVGLVAAVPLTTGLALLVLPEGGAGDA